jgi:hypothetical protein
MFNDVQIFRNHLQIRFRRTVGFSNAFEDCQSLTLKPLLHQTVLDKTAFVPIQQQPQEFSL